MCRFLNSIDDSVINPLAAELSRFNTRLCLKSTILTNQAGWRREVEAVVGGRQLGEEEQVEAEADHNFKALRLATQKLLCWS